MKNILRRVLFLMLPFYTNAQQNVDSLKIILSAATNDSLQFNACRPIYDYYEEFNRDSALYYAGKMLQLARKHNKKNAEAYALSCQG